jgi:preprotein translocase subunit Sec61beta
MSVKSESVSMPMGSAGILGITQGESLSGIQMDPRTIVVAVLVFIIAIKVLTFVIGTK